MNTTVTPDDLARGLQQLGVRPGMALEVHCSLSRFGHVQGGAPAVISTLMRAVGPGGALVMPAFRLSPSCPLTDEDRRLGLAMKIRLLGEDEEHTAMGAVADTFRRRPDVTTGPGIFRVSAWGKQAPLHAQGFGHLIETGGYALMLGVDIYRLSAMHTVESAMPADIRRRFRPCDEALRLYPEGQWMIEAWDPPAKPWYRIQEQAYADGLVADAQIGGAKCLFFPVRPVIELYRKALLEHPYELYGLV